jgi:hypothetical protein
MKVYTLVNKSEKCPAELSALAGHYVGKMVGYRNTYVFKDPFLKRFRAIRTRTGNARPSELGIRQDHVKIF